MPRPQERDGLLAIRTQDEVRAILAARGERIGRTLFYELEKSAIEKLRRDPDLRAAFRDLTE